jgi:hypothetical protein
MTLNLGFSETPNTKGQVANVRFRRSSGTNASWLQLLSRTAAIFFSVIFSRPHRDTTAIVTLKRMRNRQETRRLTCARFVTLSELDWKASHEIQGGWQSECEPLAGLPLEKACHGSNFSDISGRKYSAIESDSLNKPRKEQQQTYQQQRETSNSTRGRDAKR